MATKCKSKYRELKSGQYVRLTKPIENGNIKLNSLSRGKIVHAQNQVEADIWFFEDYDYYRLLGLDKSFYKNGRFEGIVLNVKGDSFALNFDYDEHDSIIISEEKALCIPFFNGWEDKKIPSNLYKNVNGEMVRQYNYLLIDVIDYIDDAFSEWVDKNCETRKISDEEKENGYYPEDWEIVFTRESQDKFSKMQDELELKFAQQTGFYYHFLGGTYEN